MSGLNNVHNPLVTLALIEDVRAHLAALWDLQQRLMYAGIPDLLRLNVPSKDWREENFSATAWRILELLQGGHPSYVTFYSRRSGHRNWPEHEELREALEEFRTNWAGMVDVSFSETGYGFRVCFQAVETEPPVMDDST